MKKLAQEALEVMVIAFAATLGLSVAVGVVVGIFALTSKAAKAQEGGDRRDSRWHNRNFCAQYAWWDSTVCLRKRGQPSRYYAQRQYRDPVRYYAAPREWDGDREERRRCEPMRSAVGDQHLTVDGAKKAANDAWAGLIRFHLGESAMDLSNAREITYVCSRSSIKEGGVTTLGQTLTRCEISAQPCRPLRLPAGEER